MTYKDIINELIDLSNQFANVQNTEYMQFEKFEEKVKGTCFPFVAIQSDNYNNNNNVITIQIHYVDSLDENNDNLLQIHSDFTSFGDFLDEEFIHSISTTSNFYYNVLGQMCAGGQIQMQIKLSNKC